MKLQLVVLAAGKQEGKTLEIKGPQFLIGRDPQCHLRPSSIMISKKHCALIIKDGKVYLKDFGSTNGSFVNEVQVKNAVQLKNGDKLKIGPLFFEVRLEVPAAAPQAAAPASKPAAAAAKQGAHPAAAKAGAPGGSSSRPDSEPSLDDDIAAMLLSGPSDDTVSDGPSAADDVPQGTTVFDLPVKLPPEGAAPEQQQQHQGPPPPKKPEEKPKPPPLAPDTRSAAASILEAMRKRPRS